MQFLVIEGNIGAGKTSLANMIGSRFSARVILEQFSDNPFLPGFYKDPERYSFPLELSFLAGRYNQIKSDLIEQELFSEFTVSDYYFAKSLIFANSTLSGDEYKLFRQLFDIINSSISTPDLYVYIHRDPDILLNNIKKRGRSFEQGITRSYLSKIQRSYFDFMKQRVDIRFLIIDAGDVDFVTSDENFEAIIEFVFSKNYSFGVNKVVL